MNKSQNHVWAIEYKKEGLWTFPDGSAYTTRKQARYLKNNVYKNLFPNTEFRIKKYIKNS